MNMMERNVRNGGVINTNIFNSRAGMVREEVDDALEEETGAGVGYFAGENWGIIIGRGW